MDEGGLFGRSRSWVVLGIAAVLVSWAVSAAYDVAAMHSTFSIGASLASWLLLTVGAFALLAAQVDRVPFRIFQLIPLAVLINVGLGTIGTVSLLPFYFDTIGTLALALIAGPTMGAATGLCTAVVWGAILPEAIPFAGVGAAVGFLAAAAVRSGMCASVGRVLLTGAGIGLVSGALGVFTSIAANGMDYRNGANLLTAFLGLVSNDTRLAMVAQSLISDPLDKILCLMLAAFVVRLVMMSERLDITYPGNVRQLAMVLSG